MLMPYPDSLRRHRFLKSEPPETLTYTVPIWLEFAYLFSLTPQRQLYNIILDGRVNLSMR